MQSLAEVRTEEFQEILTPGYIRTARILSAALVLGILAFASVVLLVFFKSAPQPASDESREIINLMTYVNIAAVAISLLLGKFLADRQFTPAALRNAITQKIRDARGNVIEMSPAQQCGMKIRSAWLIQAAILEAPAFMGLQVTMRAAQNGVLALDPLYAANMLSAVPALVYFLLTFPSPERLRSIFETRIQSRY